MLQNQSTEVMFEDEAHLLPSRSVLRMSRADTGEALQSLVSCAVPAKPGASAAGYVLGPQGEVLIDCFLFADGEDGLLVDCAGALAPVLADRLRSAAGRTVDVADATADWRVLALLPSQKLVTDGVPFLRAADPRPQMGTRVLRPRSEMESTLWRHELKHAGHCHRLGLLPDATLAVRHGLDVVQTHLHLQGVLAEAQVSDVIKAKLAARRDDPRPRMLPFRIETLEMRFPTVTGEPILGDGQKVAEVIAHHGLFGLALVDLSSWRHATANDIALSCADLSISLAWPTWCATEGRGRCGPLAQHVRAAARDETVF